MKPCTQCGKCCINYSDGGLTASDSDLDFWELYRPDIFEYVKNDELWFDPKTKKNLSLCPFLNKTENNLYTCDIYQNRPEECRFYPVTIEQMVQDECEMLEPNDLKNTKKAQIKVDMLMQDSRPPCS